MRAVGCLSSSGPCRLPEPQGEIPLRGATQGPAAPASRRARRARARPCLYCVRVTSGDGTDGADGGPGESPTGWDETWPLATMQCPSSAWQMPCHRQTASSSSHVHWTLHPATCRLPYGQCSGSSMLCFQVVHVHWCFRSVLAASNWCRGCPLRPACTTATGEWRPASGRAGSGAMPFLGDVRVRQASRQHKVYLTLSPPL